MESPFSENATQLHEQNPTNHDKVSCEYGTPSNSQFLIEAPQVQQRTEENISTHLEEKKYKLKLTCSELSRLKKIVNDAVKNRKTFTVNRGYNTVRKALLERGWIEKYEKIKLPRRPVPTKPEDFEEDIPFKESCETDESYRRKCHRKIMSRLLENHTVNFYWNMKKPFNFVSWANTNLLLNRFSHSLFTSKKILNSLLQEAHWYNEPGVSEISFPRCYTLEKEEGYKNFVDDFRLTACISLLNWFSHISSNDQIRSFITEDGTEPISILEFAIKCCNQYLSKRDHVDLDRDLDDINENEWEKFLTHFHCVIHENKKLKYIPQIPFNSIKIGTDIILGALKRHWPQMSIEGMKNIWILKPARKSQGRGIRLIRNINDIDKSDPRNKQRVVQKYVERPFLIYDTKFDIRLWFLVTSTEPLTVWVYRDCYLRFSSRIFDLDDLKPSVHLTNHSLQKRYKISKERHYALPKNNMWDSITFRKFLNENGYNNQWDKVIMPKMRENIVGAMLASQHIMDRRPNSFNLYGADFVLDENLRPWLLEINSRPDLSSSTSVTKELCPQCLEDVIKVVVDKKDDPHAETGHFDLVYKQTFLRPSYLGVDLLVRGVSIFGRRSNNRKKNLKSKLPQGISEDH